MTLRSGNRIRDTTTTNGTGTLTVTGTAPTGYSPFTAVPGIATNDTYLILITHQTLNEWEICLGTHLSGTTIGRGAVESSSNAGSAVTFSAGTKDVVLVQTAGRNVLNTSLDLLSGGKINFADAAVSITHSTGVLSITGAIVFMNDNLLGTRNDTNHGLIHNTVIDGPEIRGFAGVIFKKGTAGATELGRITTTFSLLVPLTITTTDANAVCVGRQGTTNPVFCVDASAATVVTGVRVTGAASGGRAFLFALSSATDEGLSIDAKGAGTIRFGATSTGAIEFSRNAVPTASDGASIGTASLQWSDGFWASGAVLNFANGNMTLTHSTNALAFSGGTVFFHNGNGFTCRSDTGVANLGFDGYTPQPQILSNFQDTASLTIGAFIAAQVSGRFLFGKSRNGTLGTNTALSANDHIGVIQWCGADGASTIRRAAELRVEATATFSTTSIPTKMFLVTTPVSSITPQDGITVSPDGSVRLPRATGTTATAANCFIDNGDSQNLIRSTSSLRFKANITDVPQHRIDRLKDLRLIEFTSLADADNKQSRFIGLAAEEVALIDPDLVIYGYADDDWDWPLPGSLSTSPRLKPGAKLIPDGVQYDRILLLQVAALQQRIAVLEAERGTIQ